MTAALIVITHKVGSTVKAVFGATPQEDDTKKIQRLRHPLCSICIYSRDVKFSRYCIYSIHVFMQCPNYEGIVSLHHLSHGQNTCWSWKQEV